MGNLNFALVALEKAEDCAAEVTISANLAEKWSNQNAEAEAQTQM